ncbi:MAG: hypothetical protein DKM50_08485 [Candidatus Margulisiibacteriota bacterium]|nr:MAG: hypothetical protein A2X43_11960 [Candidatus Margulisbacteria bacterium GWD2_39_127]OGI01854.1 MAG: hypothetical protein A2X42_04485 [Candidatus Margulisbacteria bacterium GWF2_38_17]OGI10176.1 MAG: hypothetical protein A2X41_01205 [Candidatus Margulisbacteria bacterium GWE2_39_32]PZM79487.1 MAG: hypothetical protein DKM50_08485 [Candidatus Margulisiibacteriota bacterium]HAR63842.1 hypothetical protein [Candidatus Margulisiibacteriota bacterium]
MIIRKNNYSNIELFIRELFFIMVTLTLFTFITYHFIVFLSSSVSIVDHISSRINEYKLYFHQRIFFDLIDQDIILPAMMSVILVKIVIIKKIKKWSSLEGKPLELIKKDRAKKLGFRIVLYFLSIFLISAFEPVWLFVIILSLLFWTNLMLDMYLVISSLIKINEIVWRKYNKYSLLFHRVKDDILNCQVTTKIFFIMIIIIILFGEHIVWYRLNQSYNNTINMIFRCSYVYSLH